jgi:two-component system phosphate regulon sensor histidine kinase PhoR
LVITLLAVIAVGWFSVRSGRNFYFERTREDLELRARLLTSRLPADFPNTDSDSLQRFCTTLKRISLSRITLIARDGRVLGDSDAAPEQMENHASHPEVRMALTGQPSFDVRYSITVHKNMMYFALPIRRGSEVAGVLRTSVPLTAFQTVVRALIWQIALGAIVVFVLAGILTLVLSERVSRPIREMAHGAQRYGLGDFSQKIRPPDTVELASLSEALNRMAVDLDLKIREIMIQRNEQQAILASMTQGVICVDSDERILFVNRTAQELLRIKGEGAKGRLLQACVRSSEIQRFVQQVLSSDQPPDMQEFRLPIYDNLVLQISGSSLLDSRGERIGALVVLNDVTRLRELEMVRKQFVANVSHELKTPITTIKGYVETLCDGALEDPEHARSFLERIAYNTERLDKIIEDLLSLSRIEQDVDRGQVKLVPGNLHDIVQSAIRAVSDKAKAHGIRIAFPQYEIIATPIVSRVNPTLLEQAMVNLLDNAIKYSEPGQLVQIEIITKEHLAEIRVRDHGCGIQAEHLPRLFERFYRVDKGRSRELGGTGLGLAIVKHIVEAHNGRVDVESTLGEGSIFTISIPMA